MKISQGQNLAVGLHDKDDFAPSPDGTVSPIRELSNVPGPKNLFVFLLNGPEEILLQREFPAREGGGESKVQRLWDMMYE
jgi:hypothetical protein